MEQGFAIVPKILSHKKQLLKIMWPSSAEGEHCFKDCSEKEKIFSTCTSTSQGCQGLYILPPPTEVEALSAHVQHDTNDETNDQH